MKIKLLTSRAGVDFSQNAGDVIDVPNQEAENLINAGQAEPVREARTEKAVPKRSYEKASKG